MESGPEEDRRVVTKYHHSSKKTNLLKIVLGKFIGNSEQVPAGVSIGESANAQTI